MEQASFDHLDAIEHLGENNLLYPIDELRADFGKEKDESNE